jgi:hypothetical protein
MPNTNPSITNRAQLDWKRDHVSTHAWCDMGLYVGALKTNIPSLAELELEPNVCGIKVFAGSSTGDLMIEDDAGLHDRRPACGIDIQQLRQVSRVVDDEGRADGLAALRRAAAARQNRNAGICGDLDRDPRILRVFGHDDADRFDLVDGGIRRVSAAVEGAEKHVALDLAPEARFEIGSGRGLVERHLFVSSQS